MHENSILSTIEQTLLQKPAAKLLIVRIDLKLGDALLSTSLLSLLKGRYPNVSIHWLASRYNAKAVAGNTHVAKLWVWDKKAPWQEQAGLLKALRRERFTLAIVAFSHTASLTGFVWGRLSGARWVWSYDSRLGRRDNRWSRWLAHVELPPLPTAFNEAEKYANLVRPLTGPGPAHPRFDTSVQEDAWAQHAWKDLQLPTDRPVIALFSGGNAKRTDRFWPSERWMELAQRLREEGFFVYEMPTTATDAIPFGRLAALLRKTALFVCTDGGTFHLAAASGAPTLGLFVSTDALRWAPPMPTVTFLQAPLSDATRLTVRSVVEAVKSRVERKVVVS